MRDSDRRGTRLLAPLALAAMIAGCGSKNTSAPPNDSGGVHLVVYASDRGLAAGQYDLFLYDLDGQGFRILRGLNSTFPELDPTLSSDGRFIAFQSDRGTGARSNIYLYDRSLAAFVDLPGVNTPADETEPAFSDDALRLAFVRDVGGFTRIAVDDGVPDTLLALPGLDTTAAFNDWAPSPNADASTIAFVSDRNGNPDVFVWQRGVGVRDIPALRSDSTDTEPSLSGDGTTVYFASTRGGGKGGFDVWRYDLGSSVLMNPSLNTVADERHPSSSRQGDVISFQSNRAGGHGGWDIWNYSNSTDLTSQGNEQSSPAAEIQPSLRWR